MIRRKLAVLVLVLAVALASVSLAPRALAGGTNGPLYLLCSNAWMYNVPLGTHVADVHAGYRFREHAYTYDGYGRRWSYGHSGEDPARDGYILSSHLC